MRHFLAHPALRQVARQRQRKKCRYRLPAHGRDIAQSPRQAAVPNRFRRMPIPPKVNSFQGKVGSDQRVLILLRASSRHQSQHGAVISNSSLNRGILRSPRQTANLGNQGFFGNRHGNQYKRFNEGCSPSPRRFSLELLLARPLAHRSILPAAHPLRVICRIVTSGYSSLK